MPKFGEIFPGFNEEMVPKPGFNEVMGIKGDTIYVAYVSKEEDWLLSSKTINKDEQLHLCYSTVSKMMYPHWHKPDTKDQMEIKKEGALASYQYLQDMSVKTMEDDCTYEHRKDKIIVHKAYSKFCNCLRTIHALTIQLKCKNFAEAYKINIIIISFNMRREKWRMYHKVEWVDSNGRLKYESLANLCSKKYPDPSASVLSHFSYSNDYIHQAVSKYISYCSQNLPKVTYTKPADLGQGSF